MTTYRGQGMARMEDERLLRGGGTFVDDIQLDGMLHAAVLRSTEPHARIRSIDTAGAIASPGVAAVYTGADLDGVVPDIGAIRREGMGGTPIPEHPVVLERIFHALRPGGRLIASFAGETNIADIRRIIFSVAERPPYRQYLQGRLPHHPWPSLQRYREMVAGSPFGAAEELRTETQPRPFSRRRLTGWLRTQTLTGYRPRLPPAVFEDLVCEVSEKVADLTRDADGVYVVPFVRLQLQARRSKSDT